MIVEKETPVGNGLCLESVQECENSKSEIKMETKETKNQGSSFLMYFAAFTGKVSF